MTKNKLHTKITLTEHHFGHGIHVDACIMYGMHFLPDFACVSVSFALIAVMKANSSFEEYEKITFVQSSPSLLEQYIGLDAVDDVERKGRWRYIYIYIFAHIAIAFKFLHNHCNIHSSL